MTEGYAAGRYGAVARALHWAIAIAIIVQIALGLGHDALDKVFPAMQVHKATGITILVLSLFRLFWRLTHRPPPLPDTMPRWQAGLAHTLHWTFYGMMIVVPLTGWLMSSAGPYPLNWYGLFDIPKFPLEREGAVGEAAGEGHELLGLLFIPLLAMHVGAALYHQFVVRDGVLRRML